MKFFCTLLTGVFLSSVILATSIVFPKSVAQRHRIAHDILPPIPDFNLIDCAHRFLEEVMSVSDPDEVRQVKRAFLTEINAIPKKKLKAVIKIAINQDLDTNINSWFQFNYPTVQEALELALTEVSASEAVYFARSYPLFFFQASPVIIEAIKDFSAFTVKDVEMELKYHLEAF